MNWQGAEGLRPLLVPIESLTPDPANARRHDKKNLAAIELSLRAFGQHRAAVAQLRPDGAKIVRVGNGMLEAAKTIGWSEIAALVIEESDEAAVARAIADNRAGELAEWNDDLLVAALQSVPDDLRAQIGFNAAELHRLLGSAPGLTDPDAVPEPPKDPVTKPGDVWTLGGHRLICGDATNQTDVDRVLAGEKPFISVNDAPYGVELDMEWRDRAGLNSLGPAEGSYLRSEAHRGTSISGDTRADWSGAFELVPSLEVIYAWHASSFSVEVGLGLQRIGFDLRQMIVWSKPHFVLSRTHYHYQTEPAWYAVRKGKTSRWCGTRDQSNLWQLASPKMLMSGGHEEKWNHPTQKPCECMERPMRNHGAAGDFVFDPFLGSGTSIIAAERAQRRCLGLEISPPYCDLIVERWQQHTGGKAERASS